MAEIFAIVNQKGGVGKTTTAINVAACLAASGKRTLLIDADQQGNCSSGLGIDKKNIKATFYDFIMTDLPLSEIIKETVLNHLHILPANRDLLGLDEELLKTENKETLLKRRFSEKLIASNPKKYDFIILDSPPNLDILTINIMVASNRLIIPTQPEYLSLEGLVDLIETYSRLRETHNPQLSILGVLITMNTSANNLSKEVSQDLRKHLGSLVFETVIPRNIRLAEAPGHCLPIILYDQKSAGSLSYQTLTKEILARLNLKKSEF